MAVQCFTHDYVANLPPGVGLASDLIINSKINVLHMTSNKFSLAARVHSQSHNLPNGPWQKQTVGLYRRDKTVPGICTYRFRQISDADLQTRQIYLTLAIFGD